MINITDELTYSHIMYTIITKNTFHSVQHAPRNLPSLQIRKATRYVSEQVSNMTPEFRQQMFNWKKVQDVSKVLDDLLPETPKNAAIHKPLGENWPIALRKQTSFADLCPNSLIASGHYQQCKSAYTKYNLLTRAYPLPLDNNTDVLKGDSLKPYVNDAIEEKPSFDYHSILIRSMQGLRDILGFLHGLINNSEPWQYMMGTYYIFVQNQ